VLSQKCKRATQTIRAVRSVLRSPHAPAMSNARKLQGPFIVLIFSQKNAQSSLSLQAKLIARLRRLRRELPNMRPLWKR